MSNLKTISPEAAAALVKQGAVLVDIREADEHARERIGVARHHPLTNIDTAHPIPPGDKVLIFHCRSGARTQANAARLSAAAGSCDAFVLEGGIEAWKKAGLPVVLDRKQPIEIQRQVQMTAGGLVLLGVLLGAFVSPAFYILAGLVGAGLTLAGVTGFCGMARLFALMPWNRRAAAAA